MSTTPAAEEPVRGPLRAPAGQFVFDQTENRTHDQAIMRATLEVERVRSQSPDKGDAPLADPGESNT
jgi:hypothetical protein